MCLSNPSGLPTPDHLLDPAGTGEIWGLLGGFLDPQFHRHAVWRKSPPPPWSSCSNFHLPRSCSGSARSLACTKPPRPTRIDTTTSSAQSLTTNPIYCFSGMSWGIRVVTGSFSRIPSVNSHSPFYLSLSRALQSPLLAVAHLTCPRRQQHQRVVYNLLGVLWVFHWYPAASENL